MDGLQAESETVFVLTLVWGILMVSAPSSKTKGQTTYLAEGLDLIFTTYNIEDLKKPRSAATCFPAALDSDTR